jgi:hypothetical protein
MVALGDANGHPDLHRDRHRLKYAYAVGHCVVNAHLHFHAVVNTHAHAYTVDHRVANKLADADEYAQSDRNGDPCAHGA